MDGDSVAFGVASEASPKVVGGRYEVRDRIGRGAFGEVFEVYDQRLNRLAALKTLPIDGSGSPEAAEDLKRFHMEARAVARLSHPGIVTVHDFGEAKDFAWIVMELVIGETLKAVLDRGERPSLAETVRVTCALLDALHYAHGRGIVHRDVKPANILLALTPADGLGEVRLTDFGIARIGESQQTLAGQIIGTPTAMSPEQVRGEEVDLRSDLWSVGVILYQLLTGTRPFPGGMSTIFHNILTLDPKAPSLVAPDVPSALDEVLATALAKNAKDRYPSAAAMAAALRAAAAPWRTLGLIDEEAETVRLALPVAAPPAAPAPVRRASAGWALALGFAAGALCGALATHQVLTREWPVVAGDAAPGAVIAPAILPAGSLALAAAPGPLPANPPAVAAPPDRDMPPRPRAEAEEPVLPAESPAPAAAPGPLPANPPAVAAPPDQDMPPRPLAEAEEPVLPAESLALAAAPGPLPANLPAVAAPPDRDMPPLPRAEAEEPIVPVAAAAPSEPRPEAEAEAPPPLAPVAPVEQGPVVPPLAEAGGGALPACGPDRLATRAGNHPGFGRLVFDWAAPTRHEFRRTSHGALLRFPGTGCLPSIERLAAPRNVLSIRPDEAGSGLRIATVPGARLRLSRLEGNRVVLDVFDGGE